MAKSEDLRALRNGTFVSTDESWRFMGWLALLARVELQPIDLRTVGVAVARPGKELVTLALETRTEALEVPEGHPSTWDRLNMSVARYADAAV